MKMNQQLQLRNQAAALVKLKLKVQMRLSMIPRANAARHFSMKLTAEGRLKTTLTHRMIGVRNLKKNPKNLRKPMELPLMKKELNGGKTKKAFGGIVKTAGKIGRYGKISLTV